MAIFYIPSADTWTVSCTDGTQTASQVVSITTQWQVKIVTLNYNIYLYNEGDLCVAITGGWQGRALPASMSESNTSTPSITNTSNYMKVVFNPNGTYEAGGIIEPKLDVDLTSVKTISLTYQTSGWDEYTPPAGYKLSIVQRVNTFPRIM